MYPIKNDKHLNNASQTRRSFYLYSGKRIQKALPLGLVSSLVKSDMLVRSSAKSTTPLRLVLLLGLDLGGSGLMISASDRTAASVKKKKKNGQISKKLGPSHYFFTKRRKELCAGRSYHLCQGQLSLQSSFQALSALSFLTSVISCFN